MSNQSRCMYCGSTSYGSGCIFSPHRTHIHTGDPTRCIYCGMMAYGSGCLFNPFSKMHIHGVDVGQAIKETVRKTVELSYITDRLLEKTKDSEAYKLGLINETGKLIKAPETPYEQRLVSPLSRFLQDIKKFLPTDLANVTETLKVLSSSQIYSESIDEYAKKIQLQSDLVPIIQDLKSKIANSSTEMSLESIESAVEAAILHTIL